MKTVNLSDKNYSFFIQTESKDVPKLEDIIVYVDNKTTTKNLLSLLVGKSTYNISKVNNGFIINIRGYCILEKANYSDGYFERKPNNISLVYEGIQLTLYKCSNPIVQWNDTEVDEDDCFSFINNNIEEEVEEESTEEQNTNSEETEEEVKEEEIEETKFDRDVKVLLQNGYEIISTDNFRFLNKEGAVPILAEIIDKEHYNEFKFIGKVDEKNYNFLDLENRKITFTLD